MYEDDEATPIPSNILPAFRRHRWRLAIAAFSFLVMSLIIILLLPPVYRARSVVMVETQQIPMDLVQSTVTSAASEQIDIIRQRVMTREKLLGIINKHPHFGAGGADPKAIERILEDFKKRITIEISSAQNGRQTVAIGFKVSFGSESPSVSQAVTNDLVDMFLSENVKARTQRASETTDFLKAEAEKIREELNRIESMVADYKRENSDALPEHLNLYTSMREDVRKRLSEIEQKAFSYDEQIRVLNNQLTLIRAQGGVGSNPDITALRDQYQQLLARYQPRHPDVVALKQQIIMLQASSEQEDSGIGQGSDIQNQIMLLRKKIEYLETERRRGEQTLADLHERIIRIPQVEREFVSIKRNYEAKLDQYERIVGKTQNAQMAESLELQEKAERFTLLERPVIPTSPSEPHRQKLLMLSALFSIGFPGGVVFLLGLLDRTIRDTRTLEKITGSPPLIDIPYFTTRAETSASRKKATLALALGFVGLLVAVTLLHFFYAPLDGALSEAASRF